MEILILMRSMTSGVNPELWDRGDTMTMIHSAYLFDYDCFRSYIAPIIQEVDHGNYISLYRQAEVIINSVPSNEWILHDQGTILESITPSSEIDSTNIGYLLLVILS